MQLHCGTFLILIPVAISGNYLNRPGEVEVVESLKEAVVKIFEDFISLTPVVNFVRSVEDVEIECMVDEIVEEVMKICGESMSFRLQTFDRMTKGRRRKKEFCVFFVDSYRGFRKIYERMLFGEFLY
jgi:hypothetical protein